MSVPETMRAIAIKNGKGPADALFVEDTPTPKPAASQALVKIKAFGLNRMDLLQREGMYPVPPQAPSTLGVEFSGTVAALGEGGTEDFKVGDEVFGLAYGGAYAEYIAVATGMLIHKPKELSWEEAAGIPETWITATQALHLVGAFKAGNSVLWHAGASSVSIAGIQLAKAAGASAIYVTAGSDEKISFCVDKLGATAGFNYRTQNWADELSKATDGKGVDIIVDYIGAGYFQDNLKSAALDGRIVNLAFLGGVKVQGEVDISYFLRKRVRYEGSTLRSRDEGYQRKLRDMVVENALDKLKSGDFKVFVEKVFKFEDVIEAHKLMESNQTKGKIICTI
ncbi:NAD(P)H-quinone oxidoreductase [Aspergillus stella-maris]|uniref:NAD(P)H-quinone oxidoreductase n=1 Tax=Aspergillus stella-maris TaxID=1810926 RepID=UPI003CCD9071